MKLSEIVRALDAACPNALAAQWDRTGLHAGDTQREVGKILVALDADVQTIERAISSGADLLVTHHPLVKEAPARFVAGDADVDKITRVLKAGLAVYSMHTNFDAVPGGVSDVLAERLGLTDVEVLAPQGAYRKIVVFVPEEHLEPVFLAMTDAGAGRIGAYRECSFRVGGKATFTAPADADPALGKAGRANVVEEIRLETSVPSESADGVISAMVAAHPYEEVAYDVYVLEGQRSDVGFGRVGRIEPVTFGEFARQCSQRLGVDATRGAGPAGARIGVVAVCGGSGGSLIDAAIARGADALVTGDIRYHDAQRALAMGLCMVDAGHDGTEAPAVPILAGLVRESLSAVGYTGDVDVYEAAVLWQPAGGECG